MADLFGDFTPHLSIGCHRYAGRLDGAKGHIGYLELVHDLLRVIDIVNILPISFEILTVLCICLLFRPNFLATGSRDRLDSNLDSLVLRLIISCISNVATISLSYDSAGIWLIRLCLDRCGLVAESRHEAKFLLVTQYAFLILYNFCLIGSNVIPVDLACAFVHRGFVKGLVWSYYRHVAGADDFGARFVSIVEICDETPATLLWCRLSNSGIFEMAFLRFLCVDSGKLYIVF